VKSKVIVVILIILAFFGAAFLAEYFLED